MITGGGSTQAIGSFSAHKATADNDINDQTWTKVTYDSENHDISGWYNPANSRNTPQLAGYYRFSALAQILPAVDRKRAMIAVVKNGNISDTARLGHQVASGTTPVAVSGTGVLEANGTTDYFEVFFWHEFGLNTPDLNAQASFKFQGEYIGSA